ncbi:MAG: phenylalanine--tRNA ligase subunit beta [Deferribacteres bacterium]|nr:phenylalanine--tRNA ligase subunit beta [Deferribacteres bacterium]
MKASYKWLKEFVDFNLPPDKLAHTLTMAGLEVEEIEEFEGDTIFDIGITPNRPDCLSIRGIAREISAVLEIPFKDITVKIGAEEGEGPAVEIESPELCPRYSSRIIRGVKPGPSPEWLSKRLESCGIRPASNIVDITNYVLLELGQPMHAFDLDKLTGGRIVVRQAAGVEKFRTLDGEERKLPAEALLIWDAEKPVAIAGVMGGRNTEVSESTLNILLESAYFKPSLVRRTSRALSLSTESSYRFERGVDIEAVTLALDRAAQLIVQTAGGRVTRMTDNYPEPFERGKIRVSFKKISSVIGVDIDGAFVEKTLGNLGFRVEREGEGIAAVPPGYRTDMEMDVDIIEEVARLYGYDRIPSTLPTMQMSSPPEHETQELIKTLKNSMVKSGFSEVINFSFLNPDALEKLNLPPDDKRRDIIHIRNPLRKEESAMRTTLIPALLNNIALNLNRGEKMLRFFEVSRVFLPSGGKLPDEITQFAAVYHKDVTASIWQDKHDGFYDLKGTVENLFLELKIKRYSFERGASPVEPYLHPGKSCSIVIEGRKTGSLGTLHPGVARAFDIKGDVIILEIHDIEKIREAVPARITYVPLPRYPYVERDIAIIVSKDTTVAQAEKIIRGTDTDIIESVKLFDIYTGKPIPEDKKSLAFSIRYRSAVKTLTDSEVDAVHSAIIKSLEAELGAELRS